MSKAQTGYLWAIQEIVGMGFMESTRLGGCTQGLVRDVSLKLGFRVFDQLTSET